MMQAIPASLPRDGKGNSHSLPGRIQRVIIPPGLLSELAIDAQDPKPTA
jgi:hypothetical protein